MDQLKYARSFRDLIVYQKARQVAKGVFELTKGFPREERYSLTDQVRRSSRSVGAQIAEELDLPQVCGVNEIHPEKKFLSVKRLNDGFLDTLRVKMPVLLTVSKDLCVSRHIPMGDLEKAFSNRQVIQWGTDELALKGDEVGLMGSATQVLRLHKPSLKKEGEIVTGPPQVLAEQIIKKLEALGILDEDKRYE